ncbi:MAG: N-acetylmuramoyl-L-alanine amidase [Verrucomicrobiales bacterium]|nr:N-acetylmuramoyl-L-alanine amidase [Verrucomicrobiales bacterium]
MPSSRHYYAIWVLTLLIPFYTASAQDRGHFVLDPGHGGKDPGSQRDGMNEKNLTLDLAKRIRKVLAGRGHSVTLTREKDVYVGLEDRAAVANRIPGCIFVSLHFNSHANRSVSGIETFYWPGSIEGQRLASYVQGELGRRIVTRNRGCKPEQLKVLEATQGPAVLVECGFISNRWEFQRCCSSWFKQVLAEEIAQALIRYQKLPKNQIPGKPAIIAIPVSPVSSDL